MRSPNILVIFSALLSSRLSHASVITTYSDQNCQKSFNNLNVVNGYPDGVCTPLDITISQTQTSPQAFQIAKLDEGCAVTIYGANESPLSCSSSHKIIAEFGTCYNASWIYYSVDNCLPPTSSSIILPPSTPTSTSTSSNAPDKPSHTGAIAGGVTGGVVALALLSTLIFLLLRRRQQQQQQQRNHMSGSAGAEKALPTPPNCELSNEQQVMEVGGGAFVREKAPMEVFGDEAGVEMGRNSSTMYRAELAGDSAVGDGKYEHGNGGEGDERR